MPVEFTRNDACIDIHEQIVCGSMKLMMAYDGSGRRISKTFLTKSATAASWDTVKVTHYTGIGTEVREEFHNGTREKVNVVVNMPEGLDRYKVADASQPADDNASRTFEWYLKNHLGSTMLVYGTVASTDPNTGDIGETKAAYDYRAFGEMVTLMNPNDKVTENFTGKELDDETGLGYWGERYLDLMLGVWTSTDPARFFNSPYPYMGNGYNPLRYNDLIGMRPGEHFSTPNEAAYDCLKFYSKKANIENVEYFAFVWKLDNGKYATNTKMFKGDVDSFGKEQIYEAATLFRPLGAVLPASGGLHLHGGMDLNYDSERFSEFDYQGFSSPDALNLDLYLMTPENSFQKLSPNKDVEMLLPEVDVK